MGCVRGHVQRHCQASTRHVYQWAPTCTSYIIPSTSKHIPTSLGTREKEKKGVPTFRVSMNLKSQECRKAPRCSGNSESQKATGWERGTLGLESETVCVNSATFLCQPSVLRQRRRVAGEFVILTTLAPSEGPLLQQRTLPFPVCVWVKDLLHRGVWNFLMPKTLPVWIHEPWGCRQHLSLHDKWCSSPAVYPHGLYEC